MTWMDRNAPQVMHYLVFHCNPEVWLRCTVVEASEVFVIDLEGRGGPGSDHRRSIRGGEGFGKCRISAFLRS